MTIKELKEILENFPEEREVCCIIENKYKYTIDNCATKLETEYKNGVVVNQTLCLYADLAVDE